jgi:hypothetical protein
MIDRTFVVVMGCLVIFIAAAVYIALEKILNLKKGAPR